LSRAREKALNDAITSADPGAGFEPFACAYIEFYHSDAQVKIENRELQGQQKVFSALMSLLTLLAPGVAPRMLHYLLQVNIESDK